MSLAVAWKLGYFDLDRRQRLFETVQQLRLLRGIGVAFLFGYAIAVCLGLPSALMTVLAGGIFGFRMGAVLAWSGSIMGSVFAQEIARRVARKPLERLFGRHHLLDRLKERGTVWALVTLRLIPTGPFAVLPYVAGIAGVSAKRVVLATAIAIVPSVLAYSYVGAVLVRSVVSPAGAGRALWMAGAISIALPLLAMIIGAVTGAAKRAK